MSAIGIDLGTTNSVVAIARRSIPGVLPNRDGNSLTPSVVSFVGRQGAGEPVVGRRAVNNSVKNPLNTIFSIKRLMGRQYGEERVEEVQRHYGFQLAPAPPSESEDQGVRVLLNNKSCTPEAISAIILRQIKQDAELALGEPVTKAVITVPAYFEERQRKATADAGLLAGLDVLQVLDEPTAAALAFGMGREDDRHRVLVYDLGGGTFDISLIQMYKNNYSVLAMQGDNWLGGDDFDQAIVRRMIEWTSKKYSYEPSSHQGFLIKAKEEAEAAKRALSSQQHAEILLPLTNVPSHGTVDIDIGVSRQEFEADIQEKLEKTIDLVQETLASQHLQPDDITAVLLVGGSTAIPMVHRLLAEVFGARKLKREINPMECVALGAAIRAEQLEQAGDAPQPATGPQLLAITPMHLEIAAIRGDDNDVFVPIIPKGTPYPLEKPKTHIVYPTDPKVVVLPVCEGTSPKASLNEQQGVLEFPLPEGVEVSQPIEVAFGYDKNRVLTVEVKILKTGKVYGQSIKHKRPVRKRQPKMDTGTAPVVDPWEEIVPSIRRGRIFLQGYGKYMRESDRQELEKNLVEAEQALNSKPRDEKSGRRAQLLIENKILGSGLASQVYVAEGVMQTAPAKYAPTLAQTIAQVRQAHASDQDSQVEGLVQKMRALIGEIRNARAAAGAKIAVKDAGGLVEDKG